MDNTLKAGNNSHGTVFSMKSSNRKSTSFLSPPVENHFISDTSSVKDHDHCADLDIRQGGLPQSYEDPFTLWTFPWIVLSQQDSTVLRNHARMLGLEDLRDAEEACQALEDIIFQDFPAEVFLQRPAVIQALFGLMESRKNPLPLYAFSCIQLLTSKLKCRFHQAEAICRIQENLHYHHQGDGDCSLSIQHNHIAFPRSSFSSFGSFPENQYPCSSSKSSEDSVSSADSANMESPEETLNLQLNQLPFPVYLCAVIDSCLNVLGDDIFLGCSQPLMLLDQTVRLLNCAIHSAVWISQTDSSKRVAAHLSHSLHAVASRILYHSQRKEHVFKQARASRVIYMGLVKAAFGLLDLIPLPYVSLLPEPFCSCLPWICQDECLNLSLPEIRAKFTPYLKATHQPGYDLYMQAREICSAMTHCITFLQGSTTENPVDPSTRAEKAIRSLPSLVFHESIKFVRECWLLCSRALRSFPSDSKAYLKLIIRLLVYPNTSVQKRVYGVLLDFCHRNLNVGGVANPIRNAGSDVVFLTFSPVLKEIILYGLFQPETKLFAQNILSLLTQKFLLDNDPAWECLKTGIQPFFCGLFAHSDLDSDFGRKVISWSQNQSEEDCLFDSTTRFRAAFCLMFHHNRLVRGHAVDLLTRRLKGAKLHGDTFTPDIQYRLEEDNEAPFEDQTLERSVKVWADTRLDSVVRWTALRQISVQLSKPEAQLGFARLRGPQSFIAMFRLIVDGTEKNWSPENIAMLMDCFCRVVGLDDKQRSEWAKDVKVYELIVSTVSLIPTGHATWPKLQSASATAIFLLTFNEMLLRKEGTLSICCTFYRLILVPCNLLFHDFNKNNNRTVSCDLLRTPVAEMIAIHWNVSLAGGLSAFLNYEEEHINPLEIDFAPRLLLDERTKIILRVTCCNSGFVEACCGLEKAQNHMEAIEHLDIMSIYPILWSFKSKSALSDIPPGFESCLRYISVLPHNSDDSKLLRAITDFVNLQTEYSNFGPVTHWVFGLVANKQSLFVEAFRKAGKELILLSQGRASKRVEYITSCRALTESVWKLLTVVPKMMGKEDVDVLDLLELLLESLRVHTYGPDSDMGEIGRLCRCISAYCGHPKIAKLPETIAFIPCLISCLEVLQKTKQNTSISFWSSSIVASASLALLNLASYQLQSNLFPAMVESWKGEHENMSWLLPLWAHRCPVVRSSGISIAHILIRCKEGRALIIRGFVFIPGGVWCACLSALMSADEPDLVRYTAANLLTALLEDLTPSELALSNGNSDLHGCDALFVMLDQLEFYRMITEICQSFSRAGSVRPVEEYVLSAVFRLCGNIVTKIGISIVERLNAIRFFHAALHVCFLIKAFIQPVPQLRDRLTMFRDLYAFLACCIRCDDSLPVVILHNMHSVGAAFCLLNPEIYSLSLLKSLWTNIYIFLSESLINKPVLDASWRFFHDNDQSFQACVKVCLNLSTTESDNDRLQTALLNCIHSLTLADNPQVEEILWKPALDGSSVGYLITNFLIRKFDERSPLDISPWADLFKRLLVRYDQVQKIAMDCGLVDVIIEQLLDIDSTICRDLHVHSRNLLRKRMAEPVKLCITLLISFFCRNFEAKRLANSRNLTSVLISLYITIMSDMEELHILFLRLLLTYGAACQETLSSFVREFELVHTASLTLFHVIISDLEEQLALPLPHPDIAPLLFELLGQMSLNPQCRVYLRKSISVKRAMPKPSPRKPKPIQVIDTMWLHVLANLSFFEDGQIVILTREDICTILFEYLETDGLFSEIYISSMLILRNLAFCKKGMIRLTGARGVLAKLVRLSSTHSEPKVRLYALSCLLELLFDQVKLRHAAKSISLDDFSHAKDDDEPQMFDLRARLLACLDDSSEYSCGFDGT